MDSSTLAEADSQCGGGTCGPSVDSPAVELSAATSGSLADDGAAQALELCGTGTCLPDDRVACTGSQPDAPAPPSGESESGSLEPELADAAVAADAGEAADAGSFLPTDAQPPGPVAPAVDSAFSPPAPGGSPVQLACQLVRTNGLSQVARRCGQAGSQSSGEVCRSASDCAPGLGCVGTSDDARCLPYCCGLTSPCGANAYCTHRPLYNGAANSTLEQATAPAIPVCEPIDGCNLGEPFPCPEGQQCSCGPQKVCTVVRADGATACTVPAVAGNSEGGPCPCEAGHICSQASEGGVCQKLCSLDGEGSGCNSGLCQMAGGLPSGWGICVGSSADSSR